MAGPDHHRLMKQTMAPTTDSTAEGDPHTALLADWRRVRDQRRNLQDQAESDALLDRQVKLEGLIVGTPATTLAGIQALLTVAAHYTSLGVGNTPVAADALQAALAGLERMAK